MWILLGFLLQANGWPSWRGEARSLDRVAYETGLRGRALSTGTTDGEVPNGQLSATDAEPMFESDCRADLEDPQSIATCEKLTAQMIKAYSPEWTQGKCEEGAEILTCGACMSKGFVWNPVTEYCGKATAKDLGLVKIKVDEEEEEEEEEEVEELQRSLGHRLDRNGHRSASALERSLGHREHRSAIQVTSMSLAEYDQLLETSKALDIRRRSSWCLTGKLVCVGVPAGAVGISTVAGCMGLGTGVGGVCKAATLPVPGSSAPCFTAGSVLAGYCSSVVSGAAAGTVAAVGFGGAAVFNYAQCMYKMCGGREPERIPISTPPPATLPPITFVPPPPPRKPDPTQPPIWVPVPIPWTCPADLTEAVQEGSCDVPTRRAEAGVEAEAAVPTIYYREPWRCLPTGARLYMSEGAWGALQNWMLDQGFNHNGNLYSWFSNHIGGNHPHIHLSYQNAVVDDGGAFVEEGRGVLIQYLGITFGTHGAVQNINFIDGGVTLLNAMQIAFCPTNQLNQAVTPFGWFPRAQWLLQTIQQILRQILRRGIVKRPRSAWKPHQGPHNFPPGPGRGPGRILPIAGG